MKEFEICITETLKKKVIVTARNEKEAKEIVEKDWRKGEYILDADNFAGVSFEAVEPVCAYDIDWNAPKSEKKNLPKRILIPEEVVAEYKDGYEDAIGDYISDVTGYCHYGYKLTIDEEEGENHV